MLFEACFRPSLCVLSPYLGVEGVPSGLGHNLLMQFSSLGSSKMEISETDFFDILIIQNDQISYVKHVLAPLDVFFTLFGCFFLGGGGGCQGGWGTTRLCSFPVGRQSRWCHKQQPAGQVSNRPPTILRSAALPFDCCLFWPLLKPF